MSKSTLEVCFQRIIKALEDISHLVIQWPKISRMKLIQNEFDKSAGFPGILGVIGRIHIAVKTRKDDATFNSGRKDYTSVVLQATCDHSMAFTKCSVGPLGFLDDPEVPWISPLFEDLCRESDAFPSNSHLIGDCSYPLKSWLLVPYQGDYLMANHIKYNLKLCSASSAITRAFRMLKGRFRRLSFLQMQRSDLIPRCVLACCVLHNICLKEENATAYMDEEEVVLLESSIIPSQHDLVSAAKRDHIMNTLNPVMCIE